MSKNEQNKNQLEQAMADALASVERAEKGKKSGVAPAGSEQGAASQEKAAPEEAEATHEQLLRLAADFENYRKRANREMEDARRYGIERLLHDLLPVVDNLDRALAHSEGDKSPVVEGVRMVAKQFADVLAGYGVEGFDSLGQPFDPERHEAVGKAVADDQAPGTVLEELLRGYFLHDRLLRPAQVIVAAQPPEDEESTED